MTSKQELRDEIDRVSNDRDLWKMEANALRNQRDEAVRGRDGWRRTTDVVARQRDEAIAERDEARARVAELEASILDRATTEPEATPEPRPFQAGDRVRVAEGATAKDGFGRVVDSYASGVEGVVGEFHEDGDLWIDHEGYVSPEFCTLIEPAPDDDLPTPQPVTLTLPDGTSVTFDAVVTR